ncbi:MAG: four helix bundle protein [Bacteroidales bacterium]
MATVSKFEDLEIWLKARQLHKEIIRICKYPGLSNDFEMARHLKKTSGSIMDNIAEGFEREGKKEFRQFISISKGSTSELKSQLYRCIDSNYIENEEFDKLYGLCDEISKMAKGLMNYLNKSDLKGTKYKI